MPLADGTRLGPYEVTSAIGAGGMGEVYRAKDTRLGREVALKVLPARVAGDRASRERFEREAKSISALNHPNICTLHDVGREGDTDFLVMELVDGEDLSTVIRRGRTAAGAEAPGIPLADALALARQIALALEAAHERGIVHRDLKPGNIKVTPDGTVKVLDFGLAKALGVPGAEAPGLHRDGPGLHRDGPGLHRDGPGLHPDGTGLHSDDAANSPTFTAFAPTQAGVILGTAAYMSPEQARGRAVDKRTDIWAFGCVLYEMLTGRPAFDGETVTDVLSAVVSKTPDWPALPAAAPGLRRLLGRCLEKDLRRRLHDAADVRIEIDDLIAAPAADAALTPAGPAAPRWRLAALMLVAGIGVASVFWWLMARGPAAERTVMRLNVVLSPAPAPGEVFSSRQRLQKGMAISPDGTRIVYALSQAQDGRSRLFLRGIHESEAKPIGGTEDAVWPFFSPDGQWIGFSTHGGYRIVSLKKVAVSGGSPVVLGEFSGDLLQGAAWDTDDTIVFVPGFNEGIWRVSANGGAPVEVLKTDPDRDRLIYLWPQALPRGKGVLFTTASGRVLTIDDGDIAVLEPGATEPRVVVRGGSNARYVPTGHLVYLRAGALLAVGFDLDRLVTIGTPVPVIDDIDMVSATGAAAYAFADNGTLAYFPGGPHHNPFPLVEVDRIGKVRLLLPESAALGPFSLSPDGRRIAGVKAATNDDVWIWDLEEGTPTRLTAGSGDELSPTWTPDGTRIAYGTKIERRILWRPADGTGEPEELSRGEHRRFPTSFSPDGKTLAFVEQHPSRRGDILLMALDGPRSSRPFLATDADEWGAKFSPDGRLIAYVSDESGREQVYVAPHGEPGGRRQVSTDGGAWPAWARNRPDELFYLRGSALFSRTIDARGNPAGQPRLMFEPLRFETFRLPEDRGFWDVRPDGNSFLVVVGPTYPPTTHFNIVINWFEDLRRLAGSR